MNLTNAFALVVLLASAAGCGGDTPPAPGSADMARSPVAGGDMATTGGVGGSGSGDMAVAGGGGSSGTITGQVTYTGTKTGTLKFALYDQKPGPTTPPKYYMFPTVDNPTFPYTYTLTAVVAGMYYVVAILDVAPASPAIPGPEDVVGYSMSEVTVTAGGSGMMNIDLM